MKKFSKEKGFLNFSKKADKIKASSNVPFEMRPYDTRLEVNRYVTQAQRAFKGKSNVKFPNSLSIKTLFNQNKADLQVMLKDRESKLKNLTPGTEEYRNMKRSIQLVNNGIRRINNSYKTYLNSSKRRLKKNVQVMKESGLNYTDPMIENLERDMQFRKKFNKDVELFKKNPEEYLKNLDRVNAKPMSNDIAMLNTDTGITNTTIIITDPNNFLT